MKVPPGDEAVLQNRHPWEDVRINPQNPEDRLFQACPGNPVHRREYNAASSLVVVFPDRNRVLEGVPATSFFRLQFYKVMPLSCVSLPVSILNRAIRFALRFYFYS